MQCPNCGFDNAATARFCRECGVPLTTPPATPAPIAVESSADSAPTDDPAIETVPASAPIDDNQNGSFQEIPVTASSDSPTPPDRTAPALEAGTEVEGYTIVEVRDERDGIRTYRAQAPADVCTQCGTRAAETNARFCEECGAELLPRDVLLVEYLSADETPHGAELATSLPDDPVRALLPPVSTIEHEGRRLLVVEEVVPGWQSLAELLSGHGEAPDQPAALEDADALPIALQLAQLIQFLHHNNVSLGDLTLAQLLIGPNGRVRLRDIDALQPLSDTTRQVDLLQLHHTLEELTRMPRETRKLDESSETPTTPRTLQDVLMQARVGALPDADAWVVALSALEEQQRAVKTLVAAVGAVSDVGMVRELNEDAFLTLDLKLTIAGRPVNAGVYVVADGMGGHAAGEVASALAVQSMANVVSQSLLEMTVDSDQGINDTQLANLAIQAAQQANAAVFEEGRRRDNDMGTTLTFGLVVGDRCIVGNVGDSRTYLLRDGQLQRISKDHSLVQRLVDMGQIQPDDVYTHPHRNAIMRSLGEKPSIDVDLFPLRLQPGDVLFCCSDGQWEMVRDPRMTEILTQAEQIQAAADQLVVEGNRNGGEDNITAVLVRFDEAESINKSA